MEEKSMFADFNTYSSEEERRAHILELAEHLIFFDGVRHQHPDWTEAQVEQQIIEDTLRIQRTWYEEQMVLHESRYPDLSQEELQERILGGSSVRLSPNDERYDSLMSEAKRRLHANWGYGD